MSAPGANPPPAASLSAPRGPHVLVLGGGASGVLMAVHLLSQREAGIRVTLVEGKYAPGQGLAYSTRDPDHLLNTRVRYMSAFAEDPQHFRRWLDARAAGGEGEPASDHSFVSRATYGAYLASLLKPWQGGPDGGRLRFLAANCIGLVERPDGVGAELEGGRLLMGDHAILATGHVRPGPDPAGLLYDGWTVPEGLDPEAPVVIIGSGLSMVDQVLSLLKAGHRGPIQALSRRGLLPRAHARGSAIDIPAEEVPFGQSLSRLTAWARARARRAEAEGGTWRDAVDGIRSHAQTIWQSLPDRERARFLRHAAIWWEVHRHRVPPASDRKIAEVLASGQLRLVPGAYIAAERNGDEVLVHYRPRGSDEPRALRAALAIDCRGIRRDARSHPSPLIASLLESGRARIDPLGVGLDVDGDCRVIDRCGQPSARIHAVGPVSRAAFWEITAIPDIRVQTARLARRFAHVPASTGHSL